MTDHSAKPKELVSVGKIVKPQGVKGELKVLPFSGVADDLLPYKEFFLSADTGQEPLLVSKSRAHGKFCVLQFALIAGRNAAEELVGREVFVARESMPALTEDEFYWHDFVGLTVITDQGDTLGTVACLMATGANDVLIVRGKGKEYLIPAIAEILIEVKWEAKTLVIAPIPGLLEMNDPDAV